MILGIPNISIVLAIFFLGFFFIESRTSGKGIFAGIGILFNLAALVFMLISGADFGAALLFVLTEILICYAIMQSEDKNAL